MYNLEESWEGGLREGDSKYAVLSVFSQRVG